MERMEGREEKAQPSVAVHGRFEGRDSVCWLENQKSICDAKRVTRERG